MGLPIIRILWREKEDTIMLPVAEDELGGVEFAMFAEVTLTVGETSTGLLEKVAATFA